MSDQSDADTKHIRDRDMVAIGLIVFAGTIVVGIAKILRRIRSWLP